MFHNSKGQIVSYDLIISLSIFLVLLTFVISSWNANYYAITGEKTFNDMQRIAVSTINSLASEKGFPWNWESEPENVTVIGLVNSKRIISVEKLNAFDSLDYDLVKQKLRIENYEYYFALEQGESIILEKGLLLREQDFVVNTSRVVEFNGGMAVLKFKLFKE
ncbi:MAG: hypothetical protein ABH821_01580 [archaeon]